ncbi:glycoside hydrolase family 1 protein [Murimonas intestini]|uniref:Beta-glucosidase n=1 Tax=Murimonas intestini TaxID=1337051 RepID=A0AB73T5Z4_9FIRM|nr:family 1 glycosylhydrolase [Murimonas intestini]MCR1841925.1 family 1 glycosylhydrolase [Murimonas intestini]MCR1864995.1 family 1 glycosylhydrolase [Murimonas intestini]MCR1885692.1 family 1 glycosylhydrolase [Murimonas intestini]
MSKFPKGFLKGAATAAHQVEGNNINSDYWAMEHMKYSSFTEPSLDAVDHYHRYEEDIKMMAEAGLNAYRFSVEWARIEPEQGKFDDREIEHYRKVLECCQKYGIEPVVTLHHFTSPKWLIEKGGWEQEETVELFARYCRYVVEQLGSFMHYVCTINEANMGLQIAAISARYQAQMMAKMKNTGAGKAVEATAKETAKDAEGAVQVGLNMQKMMENMNKQREENIEVFKTPEPQVFVSARTQKGDMLIMKAHQAAKKAIKEVNPQLQVGITLSLHDIQAKKGGEEKAALEWEEEFLHYTPFIRDDDFFGLQNYTRSVYDSDGICAAPAEAELTQMDYEIYPQALERCIRRVYEELQIPVIVTENGIAVEDDRKRVDFIASATDGVAQCIADGIPVKGYFYWSLLDNFEWQKGYSMTFGLAAVDRDTQKRNPKPSLAYLGCL